MMRKQLSSVGHWWAWCAIIVVASTLVGVWHARAPIAKPLAKQPQAAAASAARVSSVRVTEQIEAELAKAGCPGWMVLASEGEEALQTPELTTQPATQLAKQLTKQSFAPGQIQQISNQVTQQVPRIQYPVRLRVASRPSRPASRRVALLTASPADDPNDLLDGVPDLLSDSGNADTGNSDAGNSDAADSSTDNLATEAVEPPADPAPTATEVTPSEEDLLDVESDLLKLPAPSPLPDITPTPQSAPKLIDPQSPAEPTLKNPSKPLFFPAQPKIELPAPVAEELPPVAPQAPAQKTQPQTIPAQKTQPPRAQPPTTQPQPKTSTPSAANKDTRNNCEFIADSQYPSAEACSKCHQRNYDEWSISSHAYAMVSPMFHKFEQKINDLSQGTIGYFCYRCHSPAGVSLGISRAAPLWDLPLVAREGVTCVACHRVNERFGKVNGERRLEPGDIHAPVYGPIGGSGVAEVIANASKYKVKTSPHDRGPGQDIHAAGFCFDQLSKADFCVSCHQVAVHPGIKLEVVWEQYRASPACKKGISCQDCHMGRIPGVPSGYEVGPAAKVNDKIVNPNRKHANHVFYGPGYSIAHPGIFPYNPKSRRWSIPDWLMFDHRAGWGTDDFEERVENGEIRISFPPVWAEVDDRYDARDLVEDNLKKLGVKTQTRKQLMENGSHVDGPYFDSPLARSNDLRFHYIMTNTNEGHNLPSGSLGAQPQLWANVVLIGPSGKRLWESGYTDRWGDVADIHSEDVRNKRIPFDTQLFNLQSMFLITGAKGTDREFFLPINIDFDQLPFIRPGAQPISVINHPPFIRMESRSLPPLGSRRIPYKVPAHLLQEPGCYRLSFRLRSRTEPIYFMRFVGATREMQRAMNEGMIDFHQSSVKFFIR